MIFNFNSRVLAQIVKDSSKLNFAKNFSYMQLSADIQTYQLYWVIHYDPQYKARCEYNNPNVKFIGNLTRPTNTDELVSFIEKKIVELRYKTSK